MDEDQIEMKNELIDEHEELQIKDELNDQGFILSAIENTNCDTIIQKSTQNPKQFVKSETITIQTYPKSKPSDAFPSMKEINLPSKNDQGRTVVHSQKLIETFLQIEQGMVLIGESTLPDLPTSATIHQTSTKPLSQIKTEPTTETETIEESGIFVKSEPDIKSETIFGISESDSQHLMSVVNSSDPLDITAHEEKYRINIKCSFCPKHFASTLGLKKHLDTEHQVVEPAKNTSLTQKMTTEKDDSNKNMDQHIIKANEENCWIRITCHLCHALFDARSSFDKHFANEHEAVKQAENTASNHKIVKVHEGKPKIVIGRNESDLPQEMSNVSDDPLKISVDEEKKQHVSSVHEGKNLEILSHPPRTNRLLFSCCLCSKIFQSQAHVEMHISADHITKYG